MNKEVYQTVILGGLLHDIGKFLQRGSFPGFKKIEGKHPEVSARFVSAFQQYFELTTDVSLLKSLVQRHHENPNIYPEELLVQHASEEHRPLAHLVCQADNYSSSERGEKSPDYRPYKKVPLTSVFCKVTLDTGKTKCKMLKYDLSGLDPFEAFPNDFDLLAVDDVNAHLSAFGKEFNGLIKKIDYKNFDCLFSFLLTILEKYTWCVASDTQEQDPDVSLFDHLKSTSAIAACLYRFHESDLQEDKIRDEDKEKFILLEGDFSGIQNYIFDISHKGAAKRLRARSLYVNLVGDVLSHKFLHAFGLPACNIIMSSGGKFFLLLPNLEDSIEKIQNLQKEIDTWSYEKLNREINLNLAWTNLSGRDFGNFGEVFDHVSGRLHRAKLDSLRTLKTQGEKWDQHKFVLKHAVFEGEEKLCQSCRKFNGFYDEKQEMVLCSHCKDDLKLGQRLPKSQFLAFYKKTESDRFEILDYSVDLFSDAKKVKKDGAFLVRRMNSNDFDDLPQKCGFPISFHYLAKHIPPDKEAPATFEEIAKRAEGARLLAYLKGDVDNLGEIFAFGLKNRSISRMSTLSRMLNLFFSGWMEKTLDERFKDIYTVFSGGDDFILVGPWNQIIDLSAHIQAEFSHFTCDNPDITLSAGISLVRDRTPVRHCAESAEEILKISKTKSSDDGRGSKDQLTVFGDTFKWDKAELLLMNAKLLAQWLAQGRVSHGFVYNLLISSQYRRRYDETKDTQNLKFIPLLAYNISRNIRETSRDTLAQEIKGWAQDLLDINNEKCKHLGFIANYALMMNRRRNGTGEL